MKAKILFVEPPKDYWFLMGDYLPPPTAMLAIAAFIERELPDVEIEVIDSQAEDKSWTDIEKKIESTSPSIVATSGFTCNTYTCARVAEVAKTVDKDITTVVGGQHFSSVPEESLINFPEIDFIVRGEGEETMVELVKSLDDGGDFGKVAGLSFRKDDRIVHNQDRPLIENIDTLPYPAYHLIEKNIDRYHFIMMAGKGKRYLILEGSRGCNHRCSFCSQWKHWNGVWRTKSAKRIADEIEHLHRNLGGEFLWLSDDNFNYRTRANALWEELRQRDFVDDVSWFLQARTDDIVNNPDSVSKLRAVGNSWILTGVENCSDEILKGFKKGIRKNDAYTAMRILNDNDIFSQAMYIIGSRNDTAESIENLRQFSLDIGSQLAIFAILTPLPGSDIYIEAAQNGWIEDGNYANYDMVHAIMPTETLSRSQVQEELYRCYRTFYGSITRNIAGLFSKNKIKRRAYRHMARKSVIKKLRGLL